MEIEAKLEIAVAIACLTAVSVLLLAKRLPRSRRKQKRCTVSSCYLNAESKPQYCFKRVLADNSYSPFKHLKLVAFNDENVLSRNPYEADISLLLDNPRLPASFGNAGMGFELLESYVWVDTEIQLQELVDALRREKVFAVDTEQHGLRSFLGFTALMQISTQSDDYLVDAIALHDAMIVLRPIFANPDVCKVFHGADNDVLWLQRDFHIYIVNLFDTAKACQVLSKPQKSLAYLLEMYCGISTNKLLQREDWRQRPLPEDMVTYARTDAHYLLYIAGCLTVELKEQDNENSASNDEFPSVVEACRLSNIICLQLFTKEIEYFPGASAASSILSRHLGGQRGFMKNSHSQFQELVRWLCAWRDLMARVHDESLRFVLSDQAIVAIADKGPVTQTEICDIIYQADQSVNSLTLNIPLPSPSTMIYSHLDDLCDRFQEKFFNLGSSFSMILQKHLGPNSGCPLSIYNYSLLSKSNLKLTDELVPKKTMAKILKENGRKASRELFVQKFSCKSPVYHNCRIYASDGRLLCYCDRRKLEWYVRRDLAKLLDENPPAIMLLFEPKGRPEDEDNDFYIRSKKNICVGCGEGNHYLRYRVIPSCYRIHFPEHLKSHRSHDIVLLCVDCHEAAHSAAEKYKKQIAAEFHIPLFVQKVFDNKQTLLTSGSSANMCSHENGISPLQLRTAAMALLRHGSKMPSKRCEELIQIVMQYYGRREISDDDLENALLVSMSPHERRRFEKKRGFSFKHGTSSMIPDKDQERNFSMPVFPIANSLKPNSIDVCHKAYGEPENGPLPMDREVSISDNEGIYTHENGAYEMKEASSLSTDETRCNTASLKHDSRFSLLGHGHHGKLVVDHLLKEYGEDGIRQFCQRWRKVFVNAIHPRFLPAGWDVMHRGRREFGEFSVYNPANRSF